MSINEFLDAIEDKLPPAPATELVAFERTLGDSLPDDYRRFLVACNGGYLGGRLWFRGVNPAGQEVEAGVHHIGGFREEYYYSLVGHRRTYTGRIPAALVWVHDDPFGNAVCVGLSGPHRGQVFFWDHENEPDDEWDGSVKSASNITLLANSFTEYVAGLGPLERG